MKNIILSQTCLFTLTVFTFYSFFNCSNPFEEENFFSYELYYLSDPSTSYFDAETIGIKKLILQDKAFITAYDIEKFIILYLDDNPIRSYRIIIKDSKNRLSSDEVKPFVLILNGERYYIGEYWPSFMNIIPKSILMYKAFGKEYHLHPGDDAGNTKLKNQIIINTLENLGVEIEYKNIGQS